MDWRALDAMAENRFKYELAKARKWVEERHGSMHPSKKSELARRIAKKAVNKWLEELKKRSSRSKTSQSNPVLLQRCTRVVFSSS